MGDVVQFPERYKVLVRQYLGDQLSRSMRDIIAMVDAAYADAKTRSVNPPKPAA